MNLPNQLTLARFFLAILLFCLLYVYLRYVPQSWLLEVGGGIFLLAVVSDFLDGYLARKYGLETDFGRIADPLVDKIMVCGCFIFFLSFSERLPLEEWMVVLIIAREFGVNGIRAYLESQGCPFGARWWGKAKMVLQSVTILWIFVYLSRLEGFSWSFYLTYGLILATVLVTLVSGVAYVIYAISSRAVEGQRGGSGE
ncbi:MAG: CDP-diacylglycerol--glycerol-3-phosphate 3-phosphatidyltransferase [Planctomycetota bacterium]|nr:MAG: CDP-diacylglycerol--glycerol-3-phosphate 3-phosphatidyltransferase [Planctomycetota bacterium]